MAVELHEPAPTQPLVREAVPAEALNPGGEKGVSCGQFARELIHIQVRRLGKLQADVLADRDPEPLHQLRVGLRRLRTTLGQFGAALELPDGVTERRVASVARRTGLCRDLDVLSLRLRDHILPELPAGERQALKKVMKRLGQDRAQALQALLESLHSPRYLKLLARLHQWQQQPRFTPLGRQPLESWLTEWSAPCVAGLFLHPGWRETTPEAESLHDLRKRIKEARYSLEPLEPWCGPPLLVWIEDLRAAQDHLGELHDLQFLHQGVVENARCGRVVELPVLQAMLESQRQRHWQGWCQLAEGLCAAPSRQALHRHLLAMGSGTVALDGDAAP
ncbi:MAG: CHAD domain-containing protein [Cyanobacteriota bacterium]|nr:CHAD domain-containing protein [Cyanobacteriota bacterium]